MCVCVHIYVHINEGKHTASQSVAMRNRTSCMAAAHSSAPPPVSSRAAVARTEAERSAGRVTSSAVRAETAPASASGRASLGSVESESMSRRSAPSRSSCRVKGSD